MVGPPPQFQKESEKEARFLANPFISFPPFARATLGCYVTNSQFTLDLLIMLIMTGRAAPMRYKSVSLGWVYSRVSLSYIGGIGGRLTCVYRWNSTFWTRNASLSLSISFFLNFDCCAYAKLVCNVKNKKKIKKRRNDKTCLSTPAVFAK